MCFWMLDVFADTPTGNQRGPPSTRFARAEQKLHPSASPLWGEAGWKKDKLQNQVYTGYHTQSGANESLFDSRQEFRQRAVGVDVF